MINFRNIQIKDGDKLSVTICEGVTKEGHVVFKDAAYCLKYLHLGSYRITPLTNYAPQCKFEKNERI